jgi:hypothetical protein
MLFFPGEILPRSQVCSARRRVLSVPRRRCTRGRQHHGGSLHLVEHVDGGPVGDTIRLRVKIQGEELTALVDSSSTHSNLGVAHRLGLDITHQPILVVTIANEQQLHSPGICAAMTLAIQDQTFSIDCYALALEDFDVVLGIYWLKTLGPITWDFTARSVAFWHHDRVVMWCGIGGEEVSLAAMTATKDLMNSLLQDYTDLFAESRGLRPARRNNHHIHLLSGTAPIAVRSYRYPQLLKDEIERQCREMLAQWIIRETTSPFSSPILLVKKHHGTWRSCVDFRALNDKIKNKFLILVVDKLLDELSGACFFTKIDLRSGYHQVRMHPEDIAKTAFRTHHGHFEFLVMPFGLMNAPATFQALMDDILKPFLRQFGLVFFDDILIYSSSWETHV